MHDVERTEHEIGTRRRDDRPTTSRPPGRRSSRPSRRRAGFTRIGGSMLVGAVALAGCSLIPGGDDEAAWDPQSVEIGDIEEHEIEDDPFRVSVAPSGDRYVARVDDELCIEPLGADFDPVCVGDRDRVLPIDQIAWSPDGTQLVGTDDFSRRFDEPDVFLIDVESGDFEELTDDRADEVGDDDALLDITPFFGPDDRVHFLRAEDTDERFEVFRLDDDGEPEQVGRMRLPRDVLPLSAPRPVGSDTWIVALQTFGREDGGQVALLDMEDEEVEIIDIDERSSVVATTDGFALLASVEALTRLEPDVHSLFSVEDGRERRVRLDLDDDAREFPSAAGFSPDGSFVAVVIRDSESESRLVGAPFENGRARDEVEVADPDVFLEDADDGEAFGGTNLFIGGEIIWTEDGTLVLSRTDDRLLTVATSPG